MTEHTYPACRFHRVVDYIVDDIVDDNENNDENYENDNIVDFNDSRLAAESSAERFGATLVTAPITLPVIVIVTIIIIVIVIIVNTTKVTVSIKGD